MNKKIKTEIGLGIIIVVSVAIGGLIWLDGNKKIETPAIQKSAEKLNNSKNDNSAVNKSDQKPVVNESNESTSQNVSDMTNQNSDDPSGIMVRNGVLYDSANNIIGSLNGKTLTINFGNSTLIFTGSVDNLELGMPLEGVNSFYYDEMLITDNVAGPYAVYKPMGEVKFKCDGPLLHYNNGDYMGIGRSDIPYYYCKTNEKNFLSQYEFSAAGTGFATGAEAMEQWYKLYIKNINGNNVFFIGYLSDDAYTDNWDYYIDENYKGNNKYKEVSSKEHLDRLLKNSKNEAEINKWDKFVDSVH